MNIKKAIKFVEKELMYSEDFSKDDFEIWDNKKLQLIRLLKCGEKYEQMWEELEQEYGWCTTFYRGRLSDGGHTGHDESIKEMMNRIEQKYFPKPLSKWQKINDMIDNLNTIGRSTNIKELVHLLIELRDEELKT